MKIVFLDTTNHASEIGGGHLFLAGIVNELADRGHDVHVVTKGKPNLQIAERIHNSGIQIHIAPWGTGGIVEDVSPNFAAWLNKLSPQVYVISGSFDIGWTTLPLIDSGIATLTIGHNDSETFYAPVRHYRRFLTRAVGVSDEICETYRNDCGIAADRIEWIPYGVETNECAPDDRSVRPLRLIYVGRLDEEQKRTSDLIKVVRRLNENGVDFQLSIVGDGEEMPAVREGMSAEIASGRVTLFGWLDSSDVIEKVRAAEIFVLTSAYEGFCIALVEAMANGCAPLVTDIKSGNKQLVRNGENGFVVPIGDIGSFIEKISYLDANRDKLLEFRQKAWETGREYSVERMVAAYEGCFETAAADARSNPRTPDPGFPLMESCRSKYPLWLRRIKARLVNS